MAQIDKRFRYLRKKGRAAQRRKKGKGKKKDKSASSPDKERVPSASIPSGSSSSMPSGGISASLLGAVALTKARRTGQSAAAASATGNTSIMDPQFQVSGAHVCHLECFYFYLLLKKSTYIFTPLSHLP